jgi:murein DD-endopeptidase MepM/ murein hydrolase activator NlpD
MAGMEGVLGRIEQIQARLGITEQPTLPVEKFDDALAAADARTALAPLRPAGRPLTLGALVSGQHTGTVQPTLWTVPALGPVVSGFGERSDPFTGELRMHQGIDIDAPAGAPIWAADSGTVTFAGDRGGFGKLVIVDHGNGIETYYGHQQRIDVAVGDEVTAGHQLGLVGSTGRSTGPHLHFEMRIDGVPVDPATQMPIHPHSHDHSP